MKYRAVFAMALAALILTACAAEPAAGITPSAESAALTVTTQEPPAAAVASGKSRYFRGARLAAHNERRHPAKRARSCASKPHRGFDCFATAQSRLKSASSRLRREASLRAAGRALKNLTNVGLAAARRRFLCNGIRSR